MFRLLINNIPSFVLSSWRTRLIGFFPLVLMLLLQPTFAQEEQKDECTSDFVKIEQEFLWAFTKGWTTLVDILVRHQDLWTQRRNLMWYFCNTWFQTHHEDNERRSSKNFPDIPDLSNQCVDKWSLRFDPRQSFFMYWLCVWYDESMKNVSEYWYKWWKKQFDELTYTIPTTISWENNKKISPDIGQFISKDVKKDILKERWNLWIWVDSVEDDPCYPPTWMSRCHMWYPTTQLLEEIFSPLFDHKKAAINGVNYWIKKDNKVQAIADLSRSLYSSRDSKEWICTNSWDQFLMEADSKSDDKRSHCYNHGEAYDLVSLSMDSSFNDLHLLNSSKQTSLLDHGKILEKPCEDLKWTILTCSMSYVPYDAEWSEDTVLRSEEISRRNLIANELFFANMRYVFYSQKLLASPNLQWPWEQQDLDDKRQRALYEVEAMWEMLSMIEKATDTMTHLLAQYRSMYHQCISLTAYQWDLHYFRQRLNKSYTPLHQIQYLVDDPQTPQDPAA